MHHSISVWSWWNRQIRASVVITRLIDLLSCINVFRQLASEFLSSWILAILLLVIQLVISHRIILRTYRLFYNHASGIAATISLLPQRCRVHLPSSSSWIYRVFFDDLVYSIIVSTLNHCTVLCAHSLWSTKLLKCPKIWILWGNKLCLHGIGDRLVAMVSNCCCILDTIWHDRANSIWIHACLRSHEV